MSYAFLLLNFNRQIRGHRRHEKHFIMNLKTVALIALIASLFMLLLRVYFFIEIYNNFVEIWDVFGFLLSILFYVSLGLFFYILYKKL